MSKGVFTLLDAMIGRQDATLLSTEYLKNRLAEIQRTRAAANASARFDGKQPPYTDPRANVSDIMQTHNFYPAHIYRPHVAMASDYYRKAPDSGNKVRLVNTSGKNTIQFNFKDNNGTFLGDMAVRIVIDAVGNPDSTTVKYRYCNYPGLRMFRRVALTQKQEIIDEYYTEDALMYYKFRVPTDKQSALNRVIGQEEAKSGSYYQKDYNVTQNFIYKNGYQTPKPQQAALELWIPLMFWFNLNIEQAFRNTLAEDDQKTIIIELASLSEILQARDATTNAVIPLSFTQLDVRTCELYTRNIYVNPEIQDLFVTRTLYSFVRVHKQYKHICEFPNDRLLLNTLKYMVEQLYFGWRPNINIDNFDNWDKFSAFETTEMPIPAIVYNPLVFPVNQLVIRTATFQTPIPVVNKVSFVIHGNMLYQEYDEAFFNQYIPLMFRGVTSARDSGVYFMPFNINCDIDPSGYANATTAREYYLEYRDSTIGINNMATLYVSAQVLALLEYRDNRAVLKYYT